MPSQDTPRQRFCPDCSADISQRPRQAERCVPCAYVRARLTTKQWIHTKRATDPEWLAHNRANARRKARQKRKDNPEKVRSYFRAFQNSRYASDPDYAATRKKRTREYRRSHPEVRSEQSRRRRARKVSTLGNVSRGIKERLRIAQGSRCAFCRTRLTAKTAQLDHIVPLAKGGIHDDLNLQVLCGTCNHRKGAKDPIEFAQAHGRLL